MEPKDIRANIEALLGELDGLRDLIVASPLDGPELRARLRSMLSRLETLRQAPFVDPGLASWLAQQLIMLVDAEMGARLGLARLQEADELEREALARELAEEAKHLAEARIAMPRIERQLACLRMQLGSRTPASGPLDAAARLGEELTRHLRADASLRGEFSALLDAMRASLEGMDRMLRNLGEETPELAHACRLLDQPLPEDPEQAHALLQQARQELRQAGNRMSQAGEQLRNAMREQMSRIHTMSEQLKKAEDEARHDPLTGLANRRGLSEFLDGLGTRGYGLVLVDLDHFKRINDRYGHDCGDAVLTGIGKLLRSSRRATDLVARIGGEEFCLVFPETDARHTLRLARDLWELIATTPLATPEGALNVTASIGVAVHRPEEPHDRTLKRADQALYRAKQEGRNRIVSAEDEPQPA